MALARLASMPPELKLVTYYHFELEDLLAVSHVSTFWRALVLGDRRWNSWFEMIFDPESGQTAGQIMSSLQVQGVIPKRTIVNLCFDTKCICSKYTAQIFLPLLKRICDECLDPEDHAIMSLSAALTTFDLNEKDIANMIALRSPFKNVKLVSTMAIKDVYVAGFPSISKSPHRTADPFSAIEKYGGEQKLTAHLQTCIAHCRTAYEARIAEYNAATNKRNRFTENGDLESVEAVTLKNNKKIPKMRPKMLAILRGTIPRTSTNFPPSCLRIISPSRPGRSLRKRSCVVKSVSSCLRCFRLARILTLCGRRSWRHTRLHTVRVAGICATAVG
ncbi:hypothetical protein B0H19DRAFT_1138154 [Mycena capillaripes]|nr:hypothetical protein B0H19DRAFT_1138154 [Mycena capillaripes]